MKRPNPYAYGLEKNAANFVALSPLHTPRPASALARRRQRASVVRQSCTRSP